MSGLTPELAETAERAREAASELGLDFPEVVFELVDPDELNMVASYGGFPVRYMHWRFGMEFQHLHKSHEYGLSKIYELVINNDPCYAYLMKTNTPMEQKLVMAHVFGHADFFRQSAWFQPTDRRMMDTMANHATRVHRHVERHGAEKVEDFLDACLSLENLIDPMSLYVKREAAPEEIPDFDEERYAAGRVHRFEVKHRYMDPYVNPKPALEAERKQIAEDLAEKKKGRLAPTRDVLAFLLRRAPLQDWQADCLDIVREEAYYFAPQAMTKILNEGWACWVHSRLMTTKLLEPSELVDYCDKHSGTLSSPPGQINPYKLGLTLLRDVEDRWNRGAHGRAWRECDDDEKRRRWNTGDGEGVRKVFEVRRLHNDVTFLDAYLTPDFMEEQKLFLYGRDPRTGKSVIVDRDPVNVKRKLLQQFTNMGHPVIEAVDDNYENRGELYLLHRHEGVNLREDFARETLRAMHRLWTRPVHIETIVDGSRVLWTYDGREAGTRELGKVE
jgi:stage V sporulation protein R